jgi:hypothetical protein
MPFHGRALSEAALGWGEANLLEGWLRDQQLERSGRRRFLLASGGLGVFLLAAVSLFPAVIFNSLAAQGAAKKELSALAAGSSQAKADRAELESLRAQAILFGKTRLDTISTLNRLVAVMNAKSPNVVILQARLATEAGQLKISGKAEASTLVEANAFIGGIEEKNPGAQALLVTAQQSTVLGPVGVGFDFIVQQKTGDQP